MTDFQPVVRKIVKAPDGTSLIWERYWLDPEGYGAGYRRKSPQVVPILAWAFLVGDPDNLRYPVVEEQFNPFGEVKIFVDSNGYDALLKPDGTVQLNQGAGSPIFPNYEEYLQQFNAETVQHEESLVENRAHLDRISGKAPPIPCTMPENIRADGPFAALLDRPDGPFAAEVQNPGG